MKQQFALMKLQINFIFKFTDTISEGAEVILTNPKLTVKSNKLENVKLIFSAASCFRSM